MNALPTVLLLLHAVLMVAAAPLLAGVIEHVNGRFSGGAGVPILQPWRDLLRLSRKSPALAENMSAVTRLAPLAALSVSGTAALLVPSFTLGMATAPLADLIVLAGVLALSRAATALAASDAGEALAGAGSSRTMLAGSLGLPAILLVGLLFAQVAGTTNLDAIGAELAEIPSGSGMALGLGLLALLGVALGEGGWRRTEPLRGGEALLLAEASGWHLAAYRFATMLRRLLWLDLIGMLFLPWGIALPGTGPLAWLGGFAAWVLKTGLLGSGVAIGAAGAWMTPSRLPELLGAAAMLALLAAMLLLLGQRLA